MNNSGRAVSAAMAFYKIPPRNVIVLHDDMDCPIGKLKGKVGGGAGGHNGLKSIDEYCTPDYMRIRVGVGRPLHGEQVINWIIANFPKEDLEKSVFCWKTRLKHFLLFYRAVFPNLLPDWPYISKKIKKE